MIEYVDINNITRDELMKEYQKLNEKCEEMRSVSEKDAKNINDLSKALEAAKSIELHISKEMEEYWKKNLDQTESELDDMRKRYNKLELSHEKLQCECNSLTAQNQQLSKELNENLTKYDNSHNKKRNKEKTKTVLTENDLDRLQMLQTKKDELMRQLKEYEECSTRCEMILADFEKNKKALKDQVENLELDLKQNREDLNEKIQILESTQEQLVDANVKIASLASNENHDFEGKSLFAEVDDKRQAIRQILIEQKKNYLEMRNLLSQNEREIRNLKRENTSMLTEIRTCSTTFCNADKSLEERLYKRINQLQDQKEELKKKLLWTQSCLREMSTDNGTVQIDSILNMCKKEKEDLKQQLHCAGVQNAILEEQVRNATQNLVRWRLESLKLRKVLLDREALLQ